ncbi:Cationic amino acid transporter 1 [Platanthera zijinensis]|uniref:Cationic amino acid transporter 1 n=1 Tax=Platanthera zijinensis TaxID=2320716 RepID=A0AAP0BVP2_9ASPA
MFSSSKQDELEIQTLPALFFRLARSWTSYFATLLNHHPKHFHIHSTSLSADYSRLNPIAWVVIIAPVYFFAVISTEGTSCLNNIASIVHMSVIVFVVIAGLTKANTRILAPFTSLGRREIFSASAVLFFTHVDFDAISTMKEGTRINPAKDIPFGHVNIMSITTVGYCLLSPTLCLMHAAVQ